MYTIEEYIDAVEKALQYWVDMHFDAEKWAENWLMDKGPEYLFATTNGILENNFFSFNWKTDSYKLYAASFNWQQCPECGMLDEYLACDCDVDETITPEDDEIADLLEDLEYTIPDYILIKSLETTGFEIYQHALGSLITPIREECEEVITALQNADNKQDLFAAILWGTRIYHVNGNIMEDHASIDTNAVDTIRNDGPSSYWDKEEIKEFLTS